MLSIPILKNKDISPLLENYLAKSINGLKNRLVFESEYLGIYSKNIFRGIHEKLYIKIFALVLNVMSIAILSITDKQKVYQVGTE